MPRHTKTAIAALCAALALGAFAAASSAGAVEMRLFEPVLSLTGDCSVSAVDEVPDPGCPAGPNPASSFVRPRAIATDPHGDVYVATYGAAAEGEEGVVDVFDSGGHFITEVPDPQGPISVAVDSKGYLYVFDRHAGYEAVHRYDPEPYEPEADPPQIAYPDPPTAVSENFAGETNLAVNPEDHLFIGDGGYVEELTSAEEGNAFVEKIGQGEINGNGVGLAIDAAHNRLYVNGTEEGTNKPLILAFELEAPHALVLTLDGSTTPATKWHGDSTVAVEEASGDFFVFDGGERSTEKVYEFEADGTYLREIENRGVKNSNLAAKLTVDNGAASPNRGYLYVPLGQSGIGHSLAFALSSKCAPQVKSLAAARLTDTEAHLRATVNPCGDETAWRIEYTTEASFGAHGFEGAQLAGAGTLAASKVDQPIAASLSGLAPGGAYRYRVAVSNSVAGAEAEGRFTTYPSPVPWAPCANDALRTGPSAALPDCRAYELVTPTDTNGHSPLGLGRLGLYFLSTQSSPDGERVSFQVQGGALPGFEGAGWLAGDSYLASRDPQGWSTALTGPTGAQSSEPLPGSPSADQGYSYWEAQGEGSAVIGGEETRYVRYPDGHSALAGRGSLGVDPQANVKLLAEDGAHIVFVTNHGSTHPAPPIQLEPNAPPEGTAAIYDRTPAEVTHVVSLLPGNVTPAAGQDAYYQGASLDGRGVTFKLGENGHPDPPLYLRYNDEETYEVADEGTFAGVAEGGARVFYLRAGDLYAFDVKSGETIRFTESGDAVVVDVAASGRVVYFLSPSVLTAAPNPRGSLAAPGAENLYRSAEGQISFVATVTKEDVEGNPGEVDPVILGRWIGDVSEGKLGYDPSRTTPDGQVLLFQSRANLTGYDPEGHVEIYRYSAPEGSLSCLSCNPTGSPAQGDASLQSIPSGPFSPEPLNGYDLAGNLRSGGDRAFFQSPDPLVLGDTDGVQDVYEWEAPGLGSCEAPGGCVYLISSGQSAHPNYLFATSADGRDVFIRAPDLLVPALDPDETPSIYDARIEGGFPPPPAPAAECLGEACQPAARAPGASTPASAAFQGPGNAAALRKRCPRGKRRVKRHGRAVCRRRHHHRKRHRRHRHRSRRAHHRGRSHR
ncbi:MAG TPA: hypothetical protein VFI09_10820 [Solirubrobacterales bacterium]|nr:hypothetical protein [Solirubrobacterales bacterium]